MAQSALPKDYPANIPQKDFWLKRGSGKKACDGMMIRLVRSANSREQGESSFYAAFHLLPWLTFCQALEYIEQWEGASDDPKTREMMKNLADALRERVAKKW